MEALFSTVAQISFTIVGLFFVALTVDTGSRDFWLGDKALNKYVTVNFFILLLPGLISIGFLIPFSLFGFPAWLYIVSFLFIAYFYIYTQLLKFYKSLAYEQVSHYESAVDAKGALKLGIMGLDALTFVGFFPASYVNQGLHDFLMGSLGVFLFLLVLISVVPVYVFLRKGAESKRANESLNKNIAIDEIHNPVSQVSSDTAGIKYLLVLIGVLISFLLGLIISKD